LNLRHYSAAPEVWHVFYDAAFDGDRMLGGAVQVDPKLIPSWPPCMLSALESKT